MFRFSNVTLEAMTLIGPLSVSTAFPLDLMTMSSSRIVNPSVETSSSNQASVRVFCLLVSNDGSNLSPSCIYRKVYEPGALSHETETNVRSIAIIAAAGIDIFFIKC